MQNPLDCRSIIKYAPATPWSVNEVKGPSGTVYELVDANNKRIGLIFDQVAAVMCGECSGAYELGGMYIDFIKAASVMQSKAFEKISGIFEVLSAINHAEESNGDSKCQNENTNI